MILYIMFSCLFLILAFLLGRLYQIKQILRFLDEWEKKYILLGIRRRR